MKTMTINDKTYQEAPEVDHYACKDCDLYEHFPCVEENNLAEVIFGGTCGERKVIFKEVK